MGIFKNHRENKNKMKEANKRNKEIFESGDKPIWLGQMNYISGYPESGSQTKGSLYINNMGILYDSVLLHKIFIPIQDIIKSEYRIDNPNRNPA